jgi:hypothetical protein
VLERDYIETSLKTVIIKKKVGDRDALTNPYPPSES